MVLDHCGGGLHCGYCLGNRSSDQKVLSSSLYTARLPGLQGNPAAVPASQPSHTPSRPSPTIAEPVLGRGGTADSSYQLDEERGRREEVVVDIKDNMADLQQPCWTNAVRPPFFQVSGMSGAPVLSAVVVLGECGTGLTLNSVISKDMDRHVTYSQYNLA
jgi:hypothetical protein